MTYRLTRRQARQIAVRAQLLDSPRPTDLVEVVDRLGFLQIDPTAAIAPSADLVIWSRLGSSYDPFQLVKAIEVDRALVETVAYIRPSRDLSAVMAEARAEIHPTTLSWMERNRPFVRDVLDAVRVDGPLLSRDIPDTCVEPWPSSGWTNNRNVTKMLEALVRLGHIAISGRRGRQRYWDLAERVYPPDVVPMDIATATEYRNERRLVALGIARSTGPQVPGESPYVGEAGAEAVVDGIPGTWRVHSSYVGGPFAGRTALLSPFDRLIHDRVRAEQLFGFEYILEMYKPNKQRRWGYYALPILHGDRPSASSTRQQTVKPALWSSTPSTRTSASPRPSPPASVARSKTSPDGSTFDSMAPSHTESGWSADALGRIGAAQELELAVRRADGSFRRPVTIWVVRYGNDLYVRSWRGESAGWFRAVQSTHQARISVGGVVNDVTLVAVHKEGVKNAVDVAYRSKYARSRYATEMVSEPARSTTLKLVPRA